MQPLHESPAVTWTAAGVTEAQGYPECFSMQHLMAFMSFLFMCELQLLGLVYGLCNSVHDNGHTLCYNWFWILEQCVVSCLGAYSLSCQVNPIYMFRNCCQLTCQQRMTAKSAVMQFGHLFAKGQTREGAIRAMVVALKQVKIRGEIRTTVDYTTDMVQHEAFMGNNHHTGWLDSRIAAHVSHLLPPPLVLPL